MSNIKQGGLIAKKYADSQNLAVSRTATPHDGVSSKMYLDAFSRSSKAAAKPKPNFRKALKILRKAHRRYRKARLLARVQKLAESYMTIKSQNFGPPMEDIAEYGFTHKGLKKFITWLTPRVKQKIVKLEDFGRVVCQGDKMQIICASPMIIGEQPRFLQLVFDTVQKELIYKSGKLFAGPAFLSDTSNIATAFTGDVLHSQDGIEIDQITGEPITANAGDPVPVSRTPRAFICNADQSPGEIVFGTDNKHTGESSQLLDNKTIADKLNLEQLSPEARRALRVLEITPLLELVRRYLLPSRTDSLGGSGSDIIVGGYGSDMVKTDVLGGGGDDIIVGSPLATLATVANLGLVTVEDDTLCIHATLTDGGEIKVCYGLTYLGSTETDCLIYNILIPDTGFTLVEVVVLAAIVGVIGSTIEHLTWESLLVFVAYNHVKIVNALNSHENITLAEVGEVIVSCV